MSNEYSYDPRKLIQAIKKHPNLWDRAIPEYKIRSQKQVAWDEIYRSVIEDFDDLSEDDQREIGVTLLNKWHNLRDAFIRSVKRCIENGERKKYIYTDDLLFLLKNLQIDPDDYLRHFEEATPSSNSPVVTHLKREPEDSQIVRKRPKRNDSNEIYLDVEQYEEPHKCNKEDAAFFASILPTVSKYCDDDRLEFRVDVLNAMKKIRDKYK